MKSLFVVPFLLVITGFAARGQNFSAQEAELVALSQKKWDWMAAKDVENLSELFHEKSKFLHMSGTWGKAEELDIIKTGRIWYKKATVHQVVPVVYGNTAIVWSRITLDAHVRGNDVSNPFTVTEVFEKQAEKWVLLALSFSSVRPEHKIQE